MNLRSVVFAMLALCLRVETSDAQGFQAYLDVSQYERNFAHGVDVDAVGIGGGLRMAVGGNSGKTFGVALVGGPEYRFETKKHEFDVLVFGDLAFRIGPISFGPGGNFVLLSMPDLEDTRCLASNVDQWSTCYRKNSEDAGKRKLGNLQGLGFSFFAKGNFGPQGRAFVQTRYLTYNPNWITLHDNWVNSSTGEQIESTDHPDFKSGGDFRVSAGYVFGGANSSPKILRVQYSEQKLDFTKTLANTNGMFNNTIRQLSLGIGFGL